jgi:HK97 family phage major capsid protein
MADGAIHLNNKSLLEKADLALSDLLTGGGLLVEQQAVRFIRILIDRSKILGLATVVPMSAPKVSIPKIRFGSRIMRPAHEATALAVADRAKVDLSKIELDAKEVKAEVDLNNSVLEDSIEKDALRQTIMQMMGQAISRDIDELVIQGDTTSSDDYLALFDGMLAKATSNIVNAGGSSLNKTILRDMIKTMPSPYLGDKAAMRFMTAMDAELDYRDSISDRQTGIGDAALQTDAAVGYSGIPVVDVPLFPENLGVGGDTTNVLLTNPKNIAIGIYRNIQFETDKDIRKGVLIIVARMRLAFNFYEETAVVKATNVSVG